VGSFLLDQTPKVAGPVLSGQKIEEPGPKTSWYPEKQMLLLQLKIQFVRWTKTASVRFPFHLMRIRMNKTPSCSRTLRSNKKRPRGTCTSLFFLGCIANCIVLSASWVRHFMFITEHATSSCGPDDDAYHETCSE
jgi:hypothetical protein